MRPLHALPPLALLLSSAAFAQSRGEQWWHHVEVLAADDMKGRAIGTPEYDRAADYVIARFKALGLQPAGIDGWRLPVDITRQTITRAAVTLDGQALSVPDDIVIARGGGPGPARTSAPLVFAGYGLHIPDVGHDDFAGLDLKGKIVVVVSGGPANISGALKSDARSARGRYLAHAGALGVIAIATPKQIEIPWSRSKLRAVEPGMFLSDAGLRDLDRPFLSMSMNTDSAEKLFGGSGHSFADVAALADAARAVPTFALKPVLVADVSATQVRVRSYDIVAKMPGSDPKLAGEHVVLSAHLDHLGVGAPIAGDTIYNGAMDDASGVANLLEIATKLRADGARPKRSLLFTIVTGEEQGLLGSHAFAERPSVAKSSIVADLNFDMPLPLWPLRSVIVLGADESSLGAAAKATAEAQGLTLAPDPLPDRNAFIRSDQYSFIRAGYPSIAFKFGFALGTPEAQIEHDWRAVRYHSPSDDLAQPVQKEEAVRLNDYVAALALRVADAPERPTWNANSFFRRFAAR